MLKKHCFILVFFLVCTDFHAQTSKYFNSDYDLGSSLITCIYQDHEGIIWIGTENGLNRYDGNEFKFYQNIPGDMNSLVHNYVRDINEDAQGNLLVGTYSGVQQYIREKDLFSWTVYDSNRVPVRSMAYDILLRSNGTLLVSGEDFYTVTYRKEESLVSGPVPLGLPTKYTARQIEDSAQNLWVIKANDGVYRLDYDYMLLHYYTFDSNPTSICEIPGDAVYVSAGSSGLYSYDSEKDKFTKCGIEGLESCYINEIKYLGDGKIYLCTIGNGLLTWEPGSKKCEHLTPDNLPFDSSNTRVNSVIKDNAGNLWIGYYRKGVVMVPVTGNSFQNISNHGMGHNLLGNSTCTSLIVTKNNELVVGTNADGIYRITLENFSSVHYSGSIDKGGIPSQILCLHEDSKGRIWFGTLANGLGKIDLETGKYQQVPIGSPINAITEDMDGTILAATRGNGIFRYSPDTGNIQFLDKLNQKVGLRSEYMLKSDDNTLYIGSYDGAFGIIRNNPDQPPVTMQYLAKQIVHCICKSGEEIYFGTADGLIILNETTGGIKSFAKSDGLPGEVVCGIVSGNDNGMWISTNNGLSRYDKANGSFENFFVGDGIQGNEFIKKAACKGNDGYLFFGGNNGISFFNPSDINAPTNKWTPRCHIVQQNRNAFNITLSTAEYNAPEGIRFEYSLDGDEWILLGSRIRAISLNSMRPGKHLFEVRVVDRDKRSEAVSAEFNVRQVLALSFWAIIIYVLAILAIVYFIFKYHSFKVQATAQFNQLRSLMELSKQTNTPVDKALTQIDDPSLVSPDDRLMQRVIKVINANISDPDLTVDFIAQEVGISRVHLYRKLKEITDQTSQEFVRNIRLAKAAEMLKQKKYSIAELSEAVGYNSPSAFSTAFKSLYGVSPTDYAKKK